VAVFAGVPLGKIRSMKILVDHLTVTPTDLSFEGNAAWWRAVMPEHAELPRVLLAPI
jgi:hypothetical protein